MKLLNIKPLGKIITGTFEIETSVGNIIFNYSSGGDNYFEIAYGFTLLDKLSEEEKKELWEYAQNTFDNI